MWRKSVVLTDKRHLQHFINFTPTFFLQISQQLCLPNKSSSHLCLQLQTFNTTHISVHLSGHWNACHRCLSQDLFIEGCQIFYIFLHIIYPLPSYKTDISETYKSIIESDASGLMKNTRNKHKSESLKRQ